MCKEAKSHVDSDLSDAHTEENTRSGHGPISCSAGNHERTSRA